MKEQVEIKIKQVLPNEAKRIELPHISSNYAILIGRYGPYISEHIEAGEEGKSTSIPQGWHPGALTEEEIRKLLELKGNGGDGPEPICSDPDSGQPIYLLTGKFGPYFQMGMKNDDNPKPKRVSVPKGKDPGSMDCDEILRYMHLPRQLGIHPETEAPVVAQLGPFGPYVGCQKEYRSLKNADELFTVTLEEALQLLAMPKGGRNSSKGDQKQANAEPVVDFGTHEGKRLGVFNGRYGFYGKIGDMNFQLPREMKQNKDALAELTREQMIELSQSAKPAKKGRAKRK